MENVVYYSSVRLNWPIAQILVQSYGNWQTQSGFPTVINFFLTNTEKQILKRRKIQENLVEIVLEGLLYWTD